VTDAEIRTFLADRVDPDGTLRRRALASPPHLARLEQLLDAGVAALRLAERGWAPSQWLAPERYVEAYDHVKRGEPQSVADDHIVRAWYTGGLLRHLPGRIRAMSLSRPDLDAVFVERERLLEQAWRHHLAGAFAASMALVLSHIDGIAADATGRGFFTGKDSSRFVDDATLAGVDLALPVVRAWFCDDLNVSGPHDRLSRHGVLHGRQIGYDTEAMSMRTWVLLAAVAEWCWGQLRPDVAWLESSPS
jgi:hypothetical protein